MGVAITCGRSKAAPRLGEGWLVLRVPSLEMVTAGWLLALMAAGVGARPVACEEKACVERARELESFLAGLARATGTPVGLPSGPGPAPAATVPGADRRIELREPEATTEALESEGALRPGRSAWRVEGAGCPLGQVRVDPAACSLCEVCVAVCPTGALAASRDEAGSLGLSFEPGRCTACGACAASCPERAVSVERCLDAASLVAGRQVLVTRPGARCVSCGAVLVAGLPATALSRTGGRHLFLTPGTGRICADCRLGGRAAGPSRVG